MLGAEAEAPAGDWSGYAALEPVRAHPSRHQCVMLPLRALLAALGDGASKGRES
jgi:NifU-like protein involved in Fe-S cluster formation